MRLYLLAMGDRDLATWAAEFKDIAKFGGVDISKVLRMNWKPRSSEPATSADAQN